MSNCDIFEIMCLCDRQLLTYLFKPPPSTQTKQNNKTKLLPLKIPRYTEKGDNVEI